jgi:hypothetical protein
MSNKVELIKVDFTNNPDFDIVGFFSNLAVTLEQHNIKIYQTDKEFIAKEYIRKNNAQSSIIPESINDYLTEAFIPKGTDNLTIVQLFHNFFDEFQVKTASKLTIIDPYLFPDKYDTDYPQLLVDILSYFTNLTEIKFITGFKHYDVNLYSNISSILNISCSCTQNNEWHDRFWIIDDSKGLFVGSSLNGIGKKHTLIDKLDDVDISDIIDSI